MEDFGDSEAIERWLSPSTTSSVDNVRLDDITFGWLPERTLETPLEGTVAAIRAVGIIDPVLLRPREEGRYEVVTGHRTVLAARAAGMESVPAVVRSMEDAAALMALAFDGSATGALTPAGRDDFEARLRDSGVAEEEIQDVLSAVPVAETAVAAVDGDAATVAAEEAVEAVAAAEVAEVAEAAAVEAVAAGETEAVDEAAALAEAAALESAEAAILAEAAALEAVGEADAGEAVEALEAAEGSEIAAAQAMEVAEIAAAEAKESAELAAALEGADAVELAAEAEMEQAEAESAEVAAEAVEVEAVMEPVEEAEEAAEAAEMEAAKQEAAAAAEEAVLVEPAAREASEPVGAAPAAGLAGPSWAEGDGRWVPLPAGRPRLTRLSSAFADAPRMLRILAAEGFTGTVELDAPDGRRDVVGLLDGRCFVVFVERQGRRISETLRLPSPDRGPVVEMTVRPQPAPVMNGLIMAIRVPASLRGLHTDFLDFGGLLGALQRRAGDASIVATTPHGSGVVVLVEGTPVAAYARRTGELPGEEAEATDPGAVAELLSAGEGEVDVHLGALPAAFDLEEVIAAAAAA